MIAIIGVLVALLLPAVQAARAAARRSQCANNLRQLGLAVLNYESANRQLPPGALHNDPNWSLAIADAVGKGRNNNWRATWITLTLPYMEQAALHGRYNFKNNLYFPENRLVTAAPIATLRCPEDNNSIVNFTEDGGDHAKGNYAACFNRDDYFSLSDHDEDGFRSAFNPVAQYGARLREITDGLTNTVLLSEILTLPSPNDVRGAWGHPAGCGFVGDKDERGGNPPNRDRVNQAHYTPNANAFDLDKQDRPAYCDGDFGSGFEDDRQLRCIDGDNNPRANIGARSRHTGGVHVALGDASIRFVTDEIDAMLWALSLSTQDGVPTSLP